jgi:hypothetical protein
VILSASSFASLLESLIDYVTTARSATYGDANVGFHRVQAALVGPWVRGLVSQSALADLPPQLRQQVADTVEVARRYPAAHWLLRVQSCPFED